MKRILALQLALILFISSPITGSPAFAQTPTVHSKAELINVVMENVRNRSERFTVHYSGTQNLVDANILDEITDIDGTERNALLNSVYGLATIDAQLSYFKKTDIDFVFSIGYEHSSGEFQRLNTDLDRWTQANMSADMPDPVKAAIISKTLSDRLLYVLGPDINNAVDGYYGRGTACMGYAELTWHMLNKAGLPVKMVVGYTPDGLTDTEYMAKRLTSAELRAIAAQVEGSSQILHAWNMVQIDGRWYNLDNTWIDGDKNGKAEDGRLFPEFFLGSDTDFSRNHIWLREEYPKAYTNWWDEDSDEIRSFLKAYMNTRLFDFPQPTSKTQLNSFAEAAYRSGRGSQPFRMTKSVMPLSDLMTIGSMDSRIDGIYSEYREYPQYPNDSYVMTLGFKGRDSEAREELPGMHPELRAHRGDSIDLVQLLKNPELSSGPQVKWVSLSPSMLSGSGEQMKVLKEGRGFIGAYTRDEAVIIPVVIEMPQLSVLLNGRVLDLDPDPMLLNGRTLVPLRGIFEAMGADVRYDAEKRTIEASRGTNTLFLTLGSKSALVNGQQSVLDVPPQIVGNRAFVPARLIAESLGAQVAWDGLANQVMITD